MKQVSLTAKQPAESQYVDKKIGLMGGTFDPIHFGHIYPVLTVKEQLNLDEIWLMPNAIPPHKKATISLTKHRLAMALKVCEAYPKFKLCDIELTLAKQNLANYSVDTLAVLTKNYPAVNFVFIMGMDSLLTLTRWHQWQKLLTLCNICVMSRANYHNDINLLPPDIIKKLTDKLNFEKKEQIQIVDVAPQPYSSTEIRNLLAAGNFPENMMPKVVTEYIRTHQLYGSK